jgi:hypothetical protein
MTVHRNFNSKYVCIDAPKKAFSLNAHKINFYSDCTNRYAKIHEKPPTKQKVKITPLTLYLIQL